MGKLNRQYVVCGGVYEVNCGSLYVTVAPCSIPCWLQQNFVFSRAERVEVVYRLADARGSSICNQCTGSSLGEELFDENQVQVGDAVSIADRDKLIDPLRRHSDCFAYDLAGLGCANTTKMNIELSSQRPVVYRPYRLSHHEREKVRGMIDEMLQAGIIRESVSNYVSPIPIFLCARRMMNHVLGPARFDKATVYMDDLLIYGKAPAECINRLEEVLGLLRKANLKLNLSKCSFLHNKINFLGTKSARLVYARGKLKLSASLTFRSLRMCTRCGSSWG